MIPCYNGSQTIQKVILDFKSVLPEATIYVYDNNSSDNTAEIAKASGAVVRHEYRQGKGNVIRSIFRDIEADCYLMIVFFIDSIVLIKILRSLFVLFNVLW